MSEYYVYKYYDDEHLLYVGRTNDFVERFKQHLRENPYFNNVTRIDIATFESDGDMMIYEKYYITKFHPPLNKVDMKFSSPTFELPEPEWIIYSREEFNKLYFSSKQEEIKIKKPEIILPDNTISIPNNIHISWFKQYDMNQQIFDYKKKYSLHFETKYDIAKPNKKDKIYKWDKNEIIKIWCSILSNEIDKMPYIKDYPYDEPSLYLTIKKNNYDIMYESLNWIGIKLDKIQGIYIFGPKYKDKMIDENGIFHIEEAIQEYEILIA